MIVNISEAEYIIIYMLAKEAHQPWWRCIDNEDGTFGFQEHDTSLAEYACVCLDNVTDLDNVAPTPEARAILAGLVGRLTKPETPELNERLWRYLYAIQTIDRTKEKE